MDEEEKRSLVTGERVGLTAMVALNLVAVLANVSGVLAILRCSHLRHSLPNFFVLNLCSVDLAVAIFVLPFAAVTFYLRQWHLGHGLCAAVGFLTSLLTFASIASVCVISMERFYSIRLPMHHAAHMTVGKTLGVLAGIWVYSVLFACLPLLGVGSYEFLHHKQLCSFAWDGGESHQVYVVLVTCCYFLLPAAILILMSCGIYRVAHQSATQVRPEPNAAPSAPVPRQAPGSRSPFVTRVTIQLHEDPDSSRQGGNFQSQDLQELENAPGGEVNGPSPAVPDQEQSQQYCNSGSTGMPSHADRLASTAAAMKVWLQQSANLAPRESLVTPRSKVRRNVSQVSSWSEGNDSALTPLHDIKGPESLTAETPHVLSEDTAPMNSASNARKATAPQKVLPNFFEGGEASARAPLSFPDLPCKSRQPKLLPPLRGHLAAISCNYSRSLPSLMHVRTPPWSKQRKSRKSSRHECKLSQGSLTDPTSLANQDISAAMLPRGHNSPYQGINSPTTQNSDVKSIPRFLYMGHSQVRDERAMERLAVHHQKTSTSSPTSEKATQSSTNAAATWSLPATVLIGRSPTLHHRINVSSDEVVSEARHGSSEEMLLFSKPLKVQLKTLSPNPSEQTSAKSPSNSRHCRRVRENNVPFRCNPIPSSFSSNSTCSTAPQLPKNGDLRRHPKLHLKTVANLLAVLAAFLLLWGPYFLLHLHGVVVGTIRDRNVTELMVTWLGFSSFAVNPFLYCWMNGKIRAELFSRGLGIFCCGCRKEKRGTNNQGDNVSNGEPEEGEDFFQFLERTSSTPTAPHTHALNASQAGQQLCAGASDEISSSWF